ncbi:RHS repeat-associated core domain-containing protein, partial [Weeksellaceae bacterium A-14]
GVTIKDMNSYYPFGLNHYLGISDAPGSTSYSPSATYKNYKFGGKELQETGFYDFGARQYMADIGRWISPDPLTEERPSWTPYRYSYNNPVNYVDPTGLLEGWVEQELDGQKSYTYDAKVNTVAEATAAGYGNVTNVFESATIKGSTSIAGIETSSYTYGLTANGNVIDQNGKYVNSDFSTEKGTGIRNVQMGPFQLQSGALKMMGGPGDPFGIWEGIGMMLSTSDSNAKYAAVPLLLVKGEGDEALKVLAAEKGLWSSTKNLSPAQNAFSHFKKHGNEFPEFGNALQYSEGAHNFMKNSPAGTLMKTRSNGDVLKYNPASNTFGVTNSAGAPKTMFRPKDGIDYWLKQ